MGHQLIVVTPDIYSNNTKFKSKGITTTELQQYIKYTYSGTIKDYSKGKMSHSYCFGVIGEPVSEFYFLSEVVSDNEIEIMSIDTDNASPFKTRINLERHAVIIYKETLLTDMGEYKTQDSLYIIPHVTPEHKNLLAEEGYEFSDFPVYFISPVGTSDEHASELAEQNYQKAMIIYEYQMSRIQDQQSKEQSKEQSTNEEAERKMLEEFEEELTNSNLNFRILHRASYSIEPTLSNAGKIFMKIDIQTNLAEIFIDVDNIMQIKTPLAKSRISRLLNHLNKKIVYGTFYEEEDTVKFRYRLLYSSVNVNSQGVFKLILKLLESIKIKSI